MESDMNDVQHEELQSLLGAYALNATDALEARRLERHLGTCAECAEEVRLLRGSASALALLSDTVIETEVDDLVDEISRKLPFRRPRLVARISAGIAAVALVAAGYLGATVIDERRENDRLANVLASTSRRVPLGAQGGFQGRGVLHIASGTSALVLEDLPEAGRNRTYQLWAIAGAKPRSMTVIAGTGRVVHLFDWKGVGDRFAVTIEPAGGSPVPTTDPVLVGT
jgi:anti-sigma-K factor RskA